MKPINREELVFDATYQLGNTTVHIVAPQEMTEEQEERVLNELHYAAWAIVRSCRKKGIQI